MLFRYEKIQKLLQTILDSKRQQEGEQCDQMLKLEVAKIFQKLPKSSNSNYHVKSNVFQNRPKSCRISGIILKKHKAKMIRKIAQSGHTDRDPIL